MFILTDYMTDAVGLVLIALLFLQQRLQAKKERAIPPAAAV